MLVFPSCTECSHLWYVHIAYNNNIEMLELIPFWHRTLFLILTSSYVLYFELDGHVYHCHSLPSSYIAMANNSSLTTLKKHENSLTYFLFSFNAFQKIKKYFSFPRIKIGTGTDKRQTEWI
jgi:hypothetical protein